MTYAGNVPAVQGGAAASVAPDSAVSNMSFYLVNALFTFPAFPSQCRPKASCRAAR